ncbi:CDP-diacylglycerol--serine O-phosphatidyltransferase [Thalassovita sp.]|uniref:CDP-diacylglycerol--serine O-phosphatidyltransferase n=1 Tax=Thalassovita sp. TaxID=1979401 RepID=UPI0028810078|nr:CDP-diacylglycerol--serine O-phosphatidyltransferase [Thalassovita sp.]MDF1801898.1 CDP-diacylglycerol--serine O-phosphatidyltransferase [Thalassovita sp.]
MKRIISRSPDRDRVPFLLLLPNLVTLAGMCLGLTSIRFAMDERFSLAVLLIFLSVLMDGLDGLLARRLSATSNFGAELDSLSDFLCFGVAPGILVYQYHLSTIGSLGWIFVLIFAAAACLRLARFNVMRGTAVPSEDEDKDKTHFVGVPAPAGAMLGLMPLFMMQAGVLSIDLPPILVAFWLGLVALLMVSQLKTISPKSLNIPRGLVVVMMFTLVVGIGLIFTRPWLLLVVVNTAYLALLLHGLIKAKGRIFS